MDATGKEQENFVEMQPWKSDGIWIIGNLPQTEGIKMAALTQKVDGVIRLSVLCQTQRREIQP